MSVQTFNPSDLSQSAANWAVAQRIVGPFAPHAQVTPNLTLALDPGYLLSGTTLTEVNAQNVGPFVPPASGFRIDRVVVDRSTGAASIVTGTANSLTPPALPSGKLPVARVMLEPTTAAIINEIVVDERALADLTPQTTKVMARATLAGTDQTGVSANTWTKVNFSAADINVGGGFDTANKWFKPSVAGYYSIRVQVGISVSNSQTYGAMIYKNGTQGAYWSASSSVSTSHTAAVADIIYLNGATDYIESYAVNVNAATTFQGDVRATYFRATLLN